MITGIAIAAIEVGRRGYENNPLRRNAPPERVRIDAVEHARLEAERARANAVRHANAANAAYTATPPDRFAGNENANIAAYLFTNADLAFRSHAAAVIEAAAIAAANDDANAAANDIANDLFSWRADDADRGGPP